MSVLVLPPTFLSVQRIQDKLRWMIIALGACCVAVVLIVALTAERLSVDVSDLLSLEHVQADLRTLDDALDHARIDVGALALARDTALVYRYQAEIARAETVFARLETGPEVSASLLPPISALRADVNALETALDARAQVWEPGAASLAESEVDRRARSSRAGIGRIAAATHQLIEDRTAREQAADHILWLAVAALGLLGGAIALVAYGSMRRDLAVQGSAARAIAESESRFATILALAPDAIITVDLHGRIVNFNRSAETMFGCRASRVIGSPVETLLPGLPADVTVLRENEFNPDELWPPMIERLELEARRCSGDTFVVEAAVSSMPRYGEGLISAVLRDVTEHRRRDRREHLLAEAATRLSARLTYEEQLTAVANLAVPSVGEWSVLDVIEDGDDGRPRIHRTTSSPEDPRLEGVLWEFESHTPSWATSDPVVDVLRSGKPLFVPVVTPEWIDSRYGDAITREILRELDAQSVMIVPLALDGKTAGALTIGTRGRTATEDEFALAQLLAERGGSAIDGARLYRKSQRSTAARDAVLSVVSHDFIGALGAIGMSARRILDEAHDGQIRQGLCENILTGTAMMHRLMLDLVDISAIDANRLTVTPTIQSLAPVLRKAEEMFAPRAEAASITLTFSCPDDLPESRADEMRIVQVLSNLLDNAIKYTPAGGTVEVTAKADSREILVSVRDTGPGVSPDDLPHIFEQFWRGPTSRRTRGLGLGLAIVHGVIASHGGRVWMESTLGRGSTVYFTVPRAVLTPSSASRSTSEVDGFASFAAR